MRPPVCSLYGYGEPTPLAIIGVACDGGCVPVVADSGYAASVVTVVYGSVSIADGEVVVSYGGGDWVVVP